MNKVITVDFDDTLARRTIESNGEDLLTPISNVVNFVKSKINDGFEVYVVSFRTSDRKQEMIDFCKINELKIKNIICTEGVNKIPFLKKLKTNLHIEDRIEVCLLCKMARIDVLLVNSSKNENNIMSKFFNKI